jgi:hypothetical protein
MKKVSRILLPLLAIMLFPTLSWSQKVGSTSMQFLKVMPVARATGMGDAYSVLATGAEAIFWNPAGVATTEYFEASMTYINWIFDAQQGALGIAASLGDYGTVGLQLQYIDFGKIDEALWEAPYKDDIEYPGLTGRQFRPYAYLIGLSYAFQLTDKFSTGLTAKYAHESLYNGNTIAAFTAQGEQRDAKTWANGLMFDFGIRYNTGFRSIRIGASVQNFGPNITYAEEDNSIPLALRVGIAADLIGADPLLLPMEDNRLTLAFDLFQPNDYTQQAHIGMEYEFSDIVALRGGYKFNYDADGLTAGIGVRKNLSGTRFSVDYSYGAMDYNLGGVHRISIGAGF